VRRLRGLAGGVVGGAGGEPRVLRGDDPEAAARMARAVARVQGLLGPYAVLVPVPAGGRDPAARVAWLPWDDERQAPPDPQPPWPGGIPPPYPAPLHPAPLPAPLLGRAGAAGPGCWPERRAGLSLGGGAPVAVAGWAGPWPADEWWWDPARHRRRARLQVSTVDGRAFLLACTDGRWWVEAEYD